MTRRIGVYSLHLAILFFAVCNIAAAGDMVPLKGRFENNQGQVTGNFTHLGTFVQVVQPTRWVAANGDSVTVTYSNFQLEKEIIPGLLFEYSFDITILGGTGRFENATGSATAYATSDVAANYRWGAIDGMISRPNSGD